MRSDYVDLIKNTDRELQEIRKWINADKNRFDTKTKYLIAYSVIKASVLAHIYLALLPLTRKWQ